MTDERHRLEIRCPTGKPSEATIHLDGEQLLFVSCVELVLDCDTREATVQLTVPASMLDLSVDAAAFVSAYTPETEQASMRAAPAAEADTPGTLAERAFAEVQRRHRLGLPPAAYQEPEAPHA